MIQKNYLNTEPEKKYKNTNLNNASKIMTKIRQLGIYSGLNELVEFCFYFQGFCIHFQHWKLYYFLRYKNVIKLF